MAGMQQVGLLGQVAVPLPAGESLRRMLLICTRAALGLIHGRRLSGRRCGDMDKRHIFCIVKRSPRLFLLLVFVGNEDCRTARVRMPPWHFRSDERISIDMRTTG